jgi:hypothetical protein
MIRQIRGSVVGFSKPTRWPYHTTPLRVMPRLCMSGFQSQPDGLTTTTAPGAGPCIGSSKPTRWPYHMADDIANSGPSTCRVFKANPMALPRGARWAKLTALCKGRGLQSRPDGLTTLSGRGSGVQAALLLLDVGFSKPTRWPYHEVAMTAVGVNNGSCFSKPTRWPYHNQVASERNSAERKSGFQS